MATNLIQKIMLKYIQSLGAEIYAETQRIVPIRSGALKDSGSLSYTSDGVSIKYSAPYASSLVMVGKILDLVEASLPEGTQCEKLKKLLQVPMYDYRNEILHLLESGSTAVNVD